VTDSLTNITRLLSAVLPHSLLLTGASGFLGRILNSHLAGNFKVVSLGRDTTCDVRCDLSREVPVIRDISFVIHAAGKAHIYPRTREEINSFYEVNVSGTIHLLEAIKNNNTSRMVFISSVSVYGLDEGSMIDENFPLAGASPYAQSKIQAEQLVRSFCEEHSIPYLILRIPLVAGPEPPGNLGKMINAISRGSYVRVAGGTARKSAVLGIDVALLIDSWLLSANASSGIFNLTDGVHPSFFEWELAIRRKMNSKQPAWQPAIPGWLADFLGKLGDILPFFPVNSNTIVKMTRSCTFSDEQARKVLGWNPRPVLDNF
jgi:nucleoside-diphosphate-sugar epimerase